RLRLALRDEAKGGKDNLAAVQQAFSEFLAQRDASTLTDLRQQLATARKTYHPEDPKFRMLHLTYMELRFPNMYNDARTWQTPPTAKALTVLAAWADVGRAYRSGNAARFDSASQKFFQTVEAESTPPYPGEDSVSDRAGAVLTGAALNPPDRGLLSMEQTFNRV